MRCSRRTSRESFAPRIDATVIRSPLPTIRAAICWPVAASLRRREEPVEQVFREIFRACGLPRAIVTDNGTPFATTGVARLSRLSVWWIRLGIQPLQIQPGHPEQNPRHERMHRTLKERHGATSRSAIDRLNSRCLIGFDSNTTRSDLTRGCSPRHRPKCIALRRRDYPRRLPPLEYPGHWEIRRVGSNGCLGFQGKEWFRQSQSCKARRWASRRWKMAFGPCYFGPVLLARYDERQQRLHRI